MAAQGKLFKFFSLIGNYRNVLTNRITVTPCYLQNAGLKMETKERLKNLKIPENPKRPLTPYFRFLAEHRPLVQKEHPNWNVVDVAKQCAQDWKIVNIGIKEKYQEAYSKEFAVYEAKSVQYTASLTKEQSEALAAARKEKKDSKQKRIIKKRNRETDKPKRPVGSFLFFIKDKWTLPENKDKKLSEMLSTHKHEWQNMSDEQKAKYVKLQNDDRDRYNKQMTKWEAKMVQEGHTDIIRKESQFIASSKPSHIESPKEKKAR